MYNTILPFLLLLLMPLGVSAQFYTISKASDSVQVLSSKKIECAFPYTIIYQLFLRNEPLEHTAKVFSTLF